MNTKILLSGSKARVTNLPVEEVNMLATGNLPAYGYNPGDFIELLAGDVSVDEGRLDQCLTWLSSFLESTELSPRINTIEYGNNRDVFQIFKKKKNVADDPDHGWFMVHQILPAEGRMTSHAPMEITDSNREMMSGNQGIIIIDDGGSPPDFAFELEKINPGAWVMALGISAAHWTGFSQAFRDRFILCCRLPDLETTRMEMDSAIIWESLVAMTLRALMSDEVGLWDCSTGKFDSHIIVEMFPYGILYTGPSGTMFRHAEGSLPYRESSRRTGSIPCYDTLVTAMLAIDALRVGALSFDRKYFYDFSKRVLLNWHLLKEHGYYFDNTLEFPNLNFSSTFPGGAECSFLDKYDDAFFFNLPEFSPEFIKALETLSEQTWDNERKGHFRSFLSCSSRMADPCRQKVISSYGYIGIILSELNKLKDEVNHKTGFNNLRMFQVGALRTTDPAEIAPVITLQSVMDSYVSKEKVFRPLCIGVFGPPGSGKSFAVKEVARVISKKFTDNPFEFFEFNLTQFSGPEEINSAIDLVRASVAKGKIPIVFWDEFDCRYNDYEFGYLRYFLPSMQDGVTYVHGIPRHIGRSIFVFAGGVKASYDDMEKLLHLEDRQQLELVKTLKIPDFMSRLRMVMDIDGIDLPDTLLRDSASPEELEELRRILIKRAFIIAHQMNTHWKKAARKTSGLLLRLLVADYKFGARSMEAVIEASHAADKLVYGLPELITPPGARIHAQWRLELERRVDMIRKESGMRGIW